MQRSSFTESRGRVPILNVDHEGRARVYLAGLQVEREEHNLFHQRFHCGRASAPMIPQAAQTTRGRLMAPRRD
jgi:hypothetical protein